MRHVSPSPAAYQPLRVLEVDELSDLEARLLRTIRVLEEAGTPIARGLKEHYGSLLDEAAAERRRRDAQASPKHVQENAEERV